MKKSMVVAALLSGLLATATAQDIVIDSVSQNGSMSFEGARFGTTATVEWAASLTEAGRTNWHGLTNLVVTSDPMASDIPMFFRILGQPDTNMMNGLVAYYPFNGNANDQSGLANNAVVSGASFGLDRFGHSNSCLVVKKTDRAVTTGNISLSGGSPRTIALWFRADAEPVWPDGYLLHWGARLGDADAGGKMQTLVYLPYHINNPTPDGGVNIASDCYYASIAALTTPRYLAGSWHHLAFTYTDSLTNAHLQRFQLARSSS
jgi:hypothetical protein